jgi:hypothetical protein
MEEIVRSRIPAISCGVPLGFEKKIGYVTADDAGGAREMVAYLQQKGRKRIATITGPMDMSGGIGRLEGYRAQLGDSFDSSLVEHGDYTRESGARAMEALLSRAPAPDAVFAANDLMAAGHRRVLRTAVDDDQAALRTHQRGDGSPPPRSHRRPIARRHHPANRIDRPRLGVAFHAHEPSPRRPGLVCSRSLNKSFHSFTRMATRSPSSLQ